MRSGKYAEKAEGDIAKIEQLKSKETRHRE